MAISVFFNITSNKHRRWEVVKKVNHQKLHWGVPSDAEIYVQESGRAGRDGKLSCATTVADLGLVKGGFKSENPNNFSHTHYWFSTPLYSSQQQW